MHIPVCGSTPIMQTADGSPPPLMSILRNWPFRIREYVCRADAVDLIRPYATNRDVSVCLERLRAINLPANHRRCHQLSAQHDLRSILCY
jgi:hypothetical protein